MKRIGVFIFISIISSATLLIAQPTAGLVGYFNFNNNILNTGSATITATAINAPYTTSSNGAANNAIQFTGTTTSYIGLTDNGNLDFAGDFSISFAVLLTSLSGSQGFIDNNVNYGGYGIYFSSGTLTIQHKNGGVQSPAGLFTANTWRAICITRSGSTLNIYINGVLRATGSQGAVATTYTYAPVLGQLYFAGGGGNYVPMNGKMDEVRFYNRALSAAEVSSLVSFTVLPLTLLEFNGHTANNISILNWKTTDEINTASFDIEKSSDGRNYITVGNVAAVNTPGIHQYNFTDNSSTSFGITTVYYRLKQKDIDGRFIYSRIVAIAMDKTRQIVLLYPNPVIDVINLTVTINKQEQLQATIIDNAGRTVKQQQWKAATGSSSFSLDVSLLARGKYYLELKGETVNERKQFIKQ